MIAFAEFGERNVINGYFVAVGTLKPSFASAVKRNEADSWNPVVIEFSLAFGHVNLEMVCGPYLGSNMKNAVKTKAMIATEIIRMSAIRFSTLKRIFF